MMKTNNFYIQVTHNQVFDILKLLVNVHREHLLLLCLLIEKHQKQYKPHEVCDPKTKSFAMHKNGYLAQSKNHPCKFLSYYDEPFYKSQGHIINNKIVLKFCEF